MPSTHRWNHVKYAVPPARVARIEECIDLLFGWDKFVSKPSLIAYRLGKEADAAALYLRPVGAADTLAEAVDRLRREDAVLGGGPRGPRSAPGRLGGPHRLPRALARRVGGAARACPRPLRATPRSPRRRGRCAPAGGRPLADGLPLPGVHPARPARALAEHLRDTGDSPAVRHLPLPASRRPCAHGADRAARRR